MSPREALAFDMYGTLVDPLRTRKRLEEHVGPATAAAISEIWRQKQLEYTFRLTAMERYEDFEGVTLKALDYALALAGQQLEQVQKEHLFAEYDRLEPFSDVTAGLTRLRDAGFTMTVFSNGSPRMLAAIIESTGLNKFFDGFISVDDVRAYKPSPRVYRYVAENLQRPIETVRLISSNPFDVIGAAATGMQAAWVNRANAVFDTLGPPPDVIVASLEELADALLAAAGNEKL